MRIHSLAHAALAIALIVAPGVALTTNPTPAAAQSGADKAAAEQLFAQARKLMKRKNYAEACPKFEASFKLDPAVGTLLNLAVCFESLGKLASAWGYYREAENLAERAGQSKRAKFARKGADALETRLARVVIKAAGETPGLAVMRDDTAVSEAQFNTPIYVDAGAHEITAAASGYEPYRTEVSVVDGEEVVVEIPRLEEAPSSQPAPQQAKPLEPSITDTPPRDDHPGDRGRLRRILGLAAAGTGVALLGFGVGFGASARSAWQGAFDDGLCERDTLVCSPEGQTRTDSARTRADVSTVLVALGAALAGGGAVLYFTAPTAESATSVTPSAGPGQLGVTVSGRF